MKKLLLSFSALVVAGSMVAQQLPNADFNGNWVDCVPWTSNGNTTAQGIQPEGWTISNVIGINGMGKTTVGYKDKSSTGDSTAVRLVNNPNPFMSDQIVPGYLTLGTSWSTSVIISDKDGGTFGGVDFKFRPDAVSMKYKRLHAQGEIADNSPKNMDEAATVVAYLWKGSYVQANVPGNIVFFGSPTTVDMVDRDRNILGILTAQGGEISTKENAELIGKLNYSIKGDAEEWTDFIQPIEYLSDAVPEKFNIIIAANDYFGAPESVGCGNTLVVDDVKLVYYSRLTSFEINGAEIEGFDSEKYEYDLKVPADANASQIMATMKYPVMGQQAVAIPGFDPATMTATITVKNPAGADIDGKSEHTYTFHIIKESAPVDPGFDGTEYVGKIDIDLFGEITTLTDQKLNISKIVDNLCTLALYNFSLGEGGELGDIIIENVEVTENNGVKTFKGTKDGLVLGGGMIVADVTCEGTLTDAGIITMDINVLWHNEATTIPIKVTFTNSTSAISDIVAEDAPAVYYNINGVQTTDLTPGLYIKVQGGKATKIIVR